MPSVPDQLLHDIAARVAQRVARVETPSLPARHVLVALSGLGPGIESELDRIASLGESVVAVADCPTGSAGAMAVAMARVPGLVPVTGEAAFDADVLVAGAERVIAPSLDLSLASRVAAMQADTPASKVVLRALLAGVPVEATLDASAFCFSSSAPAGAREAVATLVSRVRELGVSVGHTSAAPPPLVRAAAAAYGAGPHPSEERFTLAEPLDEFVEFLERRPCSIEAGKPCVSCGVCEARGF